MRRGIRILLLLLVAAAVAASASAAGPGCPLAVTIAAGASGPVTAHVLAVDGRLQGTFRLPSSPQFAVPTGVSGRFVWMTDAGTVYLSDARSRSSRSVSVPGGAAVQLATTQFPGGKRWLVLVGQADRSAEALLDARTGVAQRLRLGGPVEGGAFSPDGATLLALGARTTWLVPAANPGRAVAVPSSWLPQTFSFDGRRVLFLARQGGKVLLAESDASGAHQSTADPHVGGLGEAAFLPDGDVLAAGSSGLYVTGADGRGTHRVGPGAAEYLRLRVDPRGRGAVAGAIAAGGNDANRWTWIDLHGASRHVAALDGFTLLPASAPSRYVYFASGLAGSAATSVRAGVLDLATGRATVTGKLGTAGEAPEPEVAARGRGVLVTFAGSGSMRVWLLASAGPARLLASAPIATARFSPDGGEVAVGAGTNARTARLRIVPVGGGRAVAAGAGLSVVWTTP